MRVSAAAPPGTVISFRPPPRQKAISRRSGIAWALFVGIWVIGFLDVGGDYALGTVSESGSSVSSLAQNAVSVILAMLGVTAVYAFVSKKTLLPVSPFLASFLWLTALMNGFGVAVGVVKGIPLNYVFGDSRNSLVYVVLFALLATRIGLQRIKFLFFLCCGILSAKLIYAVVMAGLQGVISWRYLLKQSVFFAPMLTVSLALSLRQATRTKYLCLSLLAALGVGAAALRGLFIGAACGIAVVVLTVWLTERAGRASRLLGTVFVLLAVSATINVEAGVDFTSRWQTDGLRDGIEFRTREADNLAQMFQDNWLVGAGLGAYSTDWEGYADWLPRPYLVELEYNNLLAKLGVVGFPMFCGSIVFLFLECFAASRRAVDPEERYLLIGLTGGLVSFLVASATNTLYSSVFYHLFAALILLAASNVTRRRPPELVRVLDPDSSLSLMPES